MNDVAKLINISDVKTATKAIDRKYKCHSKDIKMLEQSNENKRTVYVNESGLYAVLIRSRSKVAKTFQEWLIEDVLPQIRKQGVYEVQKKLKEELKELEQKLKQTQKELEKFTKKQQRKKYPCGNHVYIIDLDEEKNNEKVYKIGKTDNLEERLKGYNVGRAGPIDFLHTAKAVNALCVESSIRAHLRKYKYANSNDKFQCDLQLIIDVMTDVIMIDNKCHKTCEIENDNALTKYITELNAKINYVSKYVK